MSKLVILILLSFISVSSYGFMSDPSIWGFTKLVYRGLVITEYHMELTDKSQIIMKQDVVGKDIFNNRPKNPYMHILGMDVRTAKVSDDLTLSISWTLSDGDYFTENIKLKKKVIDKGLKWYGADYSLYIIPKGLVVVRRSFTTPKFQSIIYASNPEAYEFYVENPFFTEMYPLLNEN